MQQSTDPVAELNWLFGCSESALGIRSSYGAMIDTLKIGQQDTRVSDGGRYSGAHTDLHHAATSIDVACERVQRSRLDAAARERRTRSAFMRLDSRDKRVLQSWFYARRWPHTARQYFGQAVSILSLCASAQNVDLSPEGLCALAAGDSELARRLRAEANALYTAAVNAFVRLCGGS